MTSIQPVWQETLDFLGTPLIIEPSKAQLSSDAGLLPFRQLDERLGLTSSFVAVLNDPRDPRLIEHTYLEMVRSRVYGLLAGHADQNDHDTLRSDPVFKLVADRSPDDPDLASQPTLSRFENAIDVRSLKRLKDVFLDQFIASFERRPLRLTFDIDAVDDPAHGHQQLTFWHGYYDQNQYLPLFITCPDNDQFVMISLRPGDLHASLGADEDIEYLVRRLRHAWPDVVIAVRGDSAFGIPRVIDVCERLNILYTFGLAPNAVLHRRTEALQAEAVAAFRQEQQQARRQEPARSPLPSRLFTGFPYQAGSWSRARHVVAKAEANAQGTNRRFVVTNRPGAEISPEGTYDEYVERGDSENRNKEIKCGMEMGRLSDHRFMANLFRLYLHALALNLLVRLRRLVADPMPVGPVIAGPVVTGPVVTGPVVTEPVVTEPVVTEPVVTEPGVVATAAVPQTRIPAAAAMEAERRRRFRERRRRDPLGEGHPCTWRMLVIKVAAEVVVSARRVVIRLSASWPHLAWYRQVCERLRVQVTTVPGPG